MKYFPKVTIMIPTYNQSQYIEQAVESALAQDYKNIEIVVSDDSINNETNERLKKYIINKQIKYYHNKPKLGRVGNYYHILRHYSRGEWILNLDGDDFLINDKFISKSIEKLQIDHNIAMVFGREMIFDEISNTFIPRETSLTHSQALDGNEVFFHKRELGINFYHLSTLYNKKKAIEVGFYKDNCLGSDTLSLMKLLIHNKVVFINEVGGAWRVHGNNDSFPESIEIIIDNIKCQYNLKYFLQKMKFTTSVIDDWADETVLNRFETYMVYFLQNRNFNAAYQLLRGLKKINSSFYIQLFTNYRKVIKLTIVLISPKLYLKFKK